MSFDTPSSLYTHYLVLTNCNVILGLDKFALLHARVYSPAEAGKVRVSSKVPKLPAEQ